MAILGKPDGTAPQRLWATHLIGRSRRADLRLQNGLVSAEHASIRWNGRVWEIKDLGSRNGTWVNNERLPPGTSRLLGQGDVLAFGDVAEHWSILSDEPLQPFAERLEDGEVVLADGDMISLPEPDAPHLVVSMASDGAWRAERPTTGEEWAVEDRAVVSVGESEWRLCLPESQVGATVTLDELVPTLSNVALRFTIRSAEEHVSISALVGSREYALGAYASYYLLLYLARARLSDASAGRLREDEQGWRYQDDVLKALKVDSGALYLEAHRARGYFARGGVLGAKSLIERRRTTQELRLGVQRIILDEG